MPQAYAIIKDIMSNPISSKTENPQLSQHGTNILLGESYPHLMDAPLEINGGSCGASEVPNLNRFKQHGFHFNADNCIACHACESACSEKNDLPPHMAYRYVGSIEGGEYPDVTRINISMACNHCEDPVCLKGCPTRAYTKYLEYGAVLQDPEICFGCGYCTWVCPYNAPQLDLEKGQVQKCNMCVDRLEVGLQPACVDACLSNALDFGVIDEIPLKQQEAKLSIPSFTDPSISRPNIRFQLNQPLPTSFQRMDDVPMTYDQVESQNQAEIPSPSSQPAFKIKEKKAQSSSDWPWHKLRSREDPLVFFTLVSQFAVGAFLMLFLLPQWSSFSEKLFFSQENATVLAGTLVLIVGLQSFALLLSTLHLGKPQYFYRAMNNLRHSWVSREIATMGAFYGLIVAYSLVTIFPVLVSWLPLQLANLLPTLLGLGASVLGPLGLYCMYRCYRIPARPFWDHWHSGGAFFSSGLILGSSLMGLIFGLTGLSSAQGIAPVLRLLAILSLSGLILQQVAQTQLLRYLLERGEEASVSRMQLKTVFRKIDTTRTWSLRLLMGAAIFFILFPPAGALGMTAWSAIFIITVAHEVVGRALFYVLVVPTTVPRGFFWGNQAFESLARKSGLAEKPQVGVLSDKH